MPVGVVELSVAGGTRAIVDPLAKLLARGALPGAYGFDLGAHAMRVSRARGVAPMTLLPCAMPGSWMVNARAPSPVFRAWLSPPRAQAWEALYELLSGGSEAWLSRGAEERDAVTKLVGALCIEGHGIAAVSKVLAYWVGESVPLMDDAMIAMALGALPEPATADDPKAGAALFVPVMDWFSRAVVEHERTWIQVAREYPLAPLDTAQTLDRLLWVESWGWRLRFGAEHGPFARVKGADRTAIVRAPTRAAGAELAEAELTEQEREQWERREERAST
ncbi:MAG: hypothetical protein U0269_16495 [Polyangiales bacterium]